MNAQQIKELAEKANLRHFINEDGSLTPELHYFAETIVRKCAGLARDTDLEDVEGGDSAVLRAAKLQILEHFGVEE